MPLRTQARRAAAVAGFGLVVLAAPDAGAQGVVARDLFALPFTRSNAALAGDPAPVPVAAARPRHAPEQRGAQAADASRARAAFERGVALADQLEWAGAAEAFEESYRLYPRPGTLRNLGLAHRALGRFTRAIDELEQFLREASPPADVQAQVTQIVAEMRQNLASLTINASVQNATITLDERPVPSGEAVPADPGNHVVSVTAPGYTRSAQTITLARGEQRTLDVRLERRGGGVLSQWWFWTAVGAVVVGGTAVAIYALSGEAPPNCGSLMVCITPR